MVSDRLFPVLIAASVAAHIGAIWYVETRPDEPAQFAVEIPDRSLEIAFVEFVEPPPLPEPEPAAPIEELVEEIPMETPPEPAPVVELTPRPAEPPPVAPPPPPPPPTPVTPVVALAKPEYLRNPAPDYPRLARQRRWEGLTLLRVQVLVNGQPGYIEIQRSSGYRILDEAAVAGVRGSVFQPAKRGGVAVESWVEVPVNFALRTGGR